MITFLFINADFYGRELEMLINWSGGTPYGILQLTNFRKQADTSTKRTAILILKDVSL